MCSKGILTRISSPKPAAVPMATAGSRRQSGRPCSQGRAALTMYAMARPKHWAVMNGCQNVRLSSIHRIAA